MKSYNMPGEVSVEATALANRTHLCNRNNYETEFARLRSDAKPYYATDMATIPKGSTAVIFIAQRTGGDDIGYAQAASAMVSLAQVQPGYIGMDSVRDADGLGITVSYWASDDDAKAWRDHGEHALIRDAGRDRWYSHYSLHVTQATRSYDWQKS